MREMLVVGRGGQGVVLASQLLADTFARAGFHSQSFPEFKAERRGAPISAFLRWDDEPIHRRYKVRECDVLVVISAAPPGAQLVDLVRPGGLIILNRESRWRHAGSFEIARVPGNEIARRHGVLSSEGRPMGNVALLGACVRTLLPGGLGFLEEAIDARLGRLAEPNVAAAREGHDRCVVQRRVAGDTAVEHPPAPAAAPRIPAYPISTTDSLANHTGSWSLDRPVLTVECSACGLCVPFCPEGAISRSDGEMAIDELYCKGCGICQEVCPVHDAVHMEEVAQ